MVITGVKYIIHIIRSKEKKIQYTLSRSQSKKVWPSPMCRASDGTCKYEKIKKIKCLHIMLNYFPMIGRAQMCTGLLVFFQHSTFLVGNPKYEDLLKI